MLSAKRSTCMHQALRACAALILLCIVAGPGSAETVRLTRADGATLTARMAGDWSVCGPTVILSHGLGGDESALGWMDAPAVAAGYRVLVMEHRESGPRSLFQARRRGVGQVLADPAIWSARAEDLDVALAFARRDGCRPAPLVMGGHSMGAAPTMMEAGANGRVPYRPGSQRFDAYIAVSPQGPGTWAFDGVTAWSDVAAPVLILTGTEDSGIDGTTPQSRMQVFDLVPPGQKRLGVVVGADHLELGGRRASTEGEVAAAIAGEFLVQLRQGWAASSLDMPASLAQIQDR